MTKIKSAVVTATMAVALGAGAFAAGIPALASDAGIYTANGNGYARWTENGDTLLVCDGVSDTLGTRAYIYTPYASNPMNGTVLIKASDPNRVNPDCVSVSKNLSETARLGIKVCSYRGASVTNCDYRIIPGRG